MTAFVTGGTGFVGSAIIRRLLTAGHGVRALVRPGSDTRNLAGLPVEITAGDLGDAGALKRALTGCECLFHAAADYRLWVPEPAAMYGSNVEGTRNIMRAALASGVERVVYTSSVATLRPPSAGGESSESDGAEEGSVIGHYKRSKHRAEAEVRRLVREQGLPAIIVNPSTPVGPRDIKPTPTGRVILNAITGRMPAYVDTGLNLVHVDDVV
ncbi:MAG: NAD-dependent epimerase/dehydratase family protein, partial [Deltaproteobacteria bacterium]|nr:NAD-dependent epimerase/dehydratase family protein [Deltaproteobacteria bacterium]